MTHQINLCDCGRIIHWPGNARNGDTWTCKRCGRRSRLVSKDTPGADNTGVIGASKPPRGARGSARRPAARSAAAYCRPTQRPASRPKPQHALAATAAQQSDGAGLAALAVIGIVTVAVLAALLTA